MTKMEIKSLIRTFGKEFLKKNLNREPTVAEETKHGLFQEEMFNNWAWIQEDYIPLFTEVGKSCTFEEAYLRIKDLFKKTKLTKQDVINATRLYLHYTDSRYVRQPHYFISKGVGRERTQDVLIWHQRYLEYTKKENEKRSVNRKLQ